MAKLNKKYVIGTHVMFYEIEMYKYFIEGLVNLLETVENVSEIDIKRAENARERAQNRLHDRQMDQTRAKTAIVRANNRLKISNR